MSPSRLAGSVAIVTGAGSGIGRAIALRFLAEGACVLAVDVNADSLATLPASDSLLVRVQDVSSRGSSRVIVDSCLARFGRIDALINNAGIGRSMRLHKTSDDDWDDSIALNLSSAFRLCRDALPSLIEARGAIVNIASTLGLRGYPGLAAYSAAKAGLIGMTRNAAANYAAAGVRVNAVAPGIIATPGVAAALDSKRFQAAMVGTTPMGRPGTPEEVASAVAFLCCREAGFITGQVLAVDGGASASVFVAEEMVNAWGNAGPASPRPA